MNKDQLKAAIAAAKQLKINAQTVLDAQQQAVTYYNAVIDGLQAVLDGDPATAASNKGNPIDLTNDPGWA